MLTFSMCFRWLFVEVSQVWLSETQEVSTVTRRNIHESQSDAFESVRCDYLVAIASNDQ